MGDAGFAALIASSFCAGFSLPLARLFLVAALVLTVRDAALGRLRLRWTGPVAGWAVYSLLAVAVTAFVAATLPEGSLIQPARGLRKTEKLLWFAGALIIPVHATGRDRFRMLLAAFAAGSGLYAAAILVGHPVGAWVQRAIPFPKHPATPGTPAAWLHSVTKALGLTQAVRDWAATPWYPRTYAQALGKLGGMGQAQRLMAATLVSLGLWLSRRSDNAPPAGPRLLRAASSPWWAALLFAGLAITLKRGSLLVLLLVAAGALLRRLGWRRMLVAAALAITVALALPPLRYRLVELPDELRFEKGGRVLMWTDLAPEMRRRHPWGVGFRGLTYESLRYATCNGWRLEKNQNHLHSNPVQVTVELGWAGLVTYFVWMVLAFRSASRRRRDGDAASAVPLLLIAALFLNGLVEYNLVDGETVLVYGLAMGLAEAPDDDSGGGVTRRGRTTAA